MAGVFLLKYLKERKITYYAVACGVMVVITLGQAVTFISTKVTTNEYIINALNADQISAPMIDNDTLYWFNGMTRDNLMSRSVSTSDENVTGEITRINVPAVNISFTNASGQEAYIEPPILAYKGYHAYSAGKELKVTTGDNFRIRVEVPTESEGVISIKFKEPILWRLAEVITALSWIAVIVYVFKRLLRGNK